MTDQWTLSRVVGHTGQPVGEWQIGMPDERSENLHVEAVVVVPTAEVDRLHEALAYAVASLRAASKDHGCEWCDGEADTVERLADTKNHKDGQ